MKMNSNLFGDRLKSYVTRPEDTSWTFTAVLATALILLVAATCILLQRAMGTLFVPFVAGCALAATLHSVLATVSVRTARTGATTRCSTLMSELRTSIARTRICQTIYSVWWRWNTPAGTIQPTQRCGTATSDKYSDL
ncbi:hypothetical protein [Yaravirus sp. 'brasiliensis']|uniref:Uncharacterized protein n=1 Tax=Yaravirus sp. 'brasiliensis' TaxID=2739681 RepID=A0AAE7B4D6_9VIRU|nr:hypothetical protein QKS73_gp52 [Yaravirus brasiliensis]QKE44425.1 hypothetical protein [Yaravirus brasiliensis]